MKRYMMQHKMTGSITSILLTETEHETFLAQGWKDLTEEEYKKLEKEIHNGR